MRIPLCSSWTALLILVAALSPSGVLGQSLSIIKKGENSYSIEASVPANDPHTLQTSENLELWIDVQQNVPANYSLTVETSGTPKRYYRLISTPPPPPPIRVLIISDSMASDCCGWGGGIYGYFKPEATVVNYAMAWAGTRVFLQSAELEKMLLIKPDYVLMQYGFIDGGTDPDRSTPLPEFADNLRTIVEKVRSFNGVPIMMTLHAARLWDENGKIIPAFEERNEVTRQLSVELKTPLIDLYKITLPIFTELGPTGVAFMEYAPGDFMHFSPAGAKYVARLVANALPPSLAPYLTNVLEPPPTP
jgi:lysophospholipase L1-like esterase